MLDETPKIHGLISFCKKSYLLMLYSYSEYHLYYEGVEKYNNKLPYHFHILGCALFFPEYTHQNLGTESKRQFLTAFIAISELMQIKGNISYYNRVLNYVEKNKKDNRKDIKIWLADDIVRQTIEDIIEKPFIAHVSLKTSCHKIKGYENYRSNLGVELDRSPTGTVRKIPQFAGWKKVSTTSGGRHDEWKKIFDDIIENVPPPR